MKAQIFLFLYRIVFLFLHYNYNVKYLETMSNFSVFLDTCIIPWVTNENSPY